VTADVAIREAGPGDLPAAADLLGTCGYGDDLHRLPALRFIQEAADGGVFIAEDPTGVVAVSAAVGFGATGWLSALGVDARWRHRRVATRLMDARLTWLRERGAPTVHLLATDGGRAVHHQLGCVEEGPWTILGLPPLPARGEPPLGVRRLGDADTSAVAALDAMATGEDRRLVLDAYWPHGGLAVERDGELAGFHLDSAWGAGPTVAKDADAGVQILDALRRRSDRITWVLLPAANEEACARLPRDGYSMSLTRMRHGPPVPWRAEMIFSAGNWYWG
jgi:N-acetylglutamate synthase-like GNAT family acetyltransferase